MSASLWVQSTAAFFWGLLLSMSIMLNLHHLIDLPTDTRLFGGMLLAFVIWAAVISYCLSRDNAWQAARRCGPWLAGSVVLNLVQFLLAGQT